MLIYSTTYRNPSFKLHANIEYIKTKGNEENEFKHLER